MRNGKMAGHKIPCTQKVHKQVDVVTAHTTGREEQERKPEKEQQEAI